jgi:uncharacterized protein YndB with AHSA1/START domain
MAQLRDKHGATNPPALVISRRFAAPRGLVFKAWSSAEHMKRWFSPAGLTVPEAEIDFRPGGVCAICMRTADGKDYWTRGSYLEIAPPERLVFDGGVTIEGKERFKVHTIVTFAAEGDATLMTVRQDYEILDPAFGDAVAGASEGWRTTLDKLASEVARIAAAA